MREIDNVTRRQALALVGATALSFTGVRSATAATNWILSSAYPDNSHMLRNNRLFAEAIAKRTGGELNIVAHGNAALFKLPETKRAVQTNQVQLGEVWLATLANEDPIYAIEALPFFVKDEAQTNTLWNVQKPYVARRFEKQGLLLLHGVIWPGQSLFVRKPIKNFDDLKGTKFRVQNPTTTRLAELMGVVGVKVETADLPQAFLTGIVDGMYTSNATGASAGSWDYCKYIYETNAWFPRNVTFVNKTAFDRLPKNMQDIILEESAVAEARGFKMALEETQKANELLQSKGVNILPPSAEMIEKFRSLGVTMTDEWLSTAGEDGKKIVAEFNSHSRQ